MKAYITTLVQLTQKLQLLLQLLSCRITSCHQLIVLKIPPEVLIHPAQLPKQHRFKVPKLTRHILIPQAQLAKQHLFKVPKLTLHNLIPQAQLPKQRRFKVLRISQLHLLILFHQQVPQPLPFFQLLQLLFPVSHMCFAYKIYLLFLQIFPFSRHALV